jgi:hypothetical protein
MKIFGIKTKEITNDLAYNTTKNFLIYTGS